MEISRDNLHVVNIVVFLSILIFHVVRFGMGIEITVSGYDIPLWMSLGFAVLVGVLVWQNWLKTSMNRFTVAKIALGLIILDILSIAYLWYKEIEFLGISGNEYLVPFIIDFAIVGALVYYLRKDD